mmetsp:Transcript_53938/g.150016  ORF Transcript_53938/g.150016 Transcript_53938/m.150016 type:complete len:202 (-) Transcript_53938:997-1602(-)
MPLSSSMTSPRMNPACSAQSPGITFLMITGAGGNDLNPRPILVTLFPQMTSATVPICVHSVGWRPQKLMFAMLPLARRSRSSLFSRSTSAGLSSDGTSEISNVFSSASSGAKVTVFLPCMSGWPSLSVVPLGVTEPALEPSLMTCRNARLPRWDDLSSACSALVLGFVTSGAKVGQAFASADPSLRASRGVATLGGHLANS